MTTRWEEETFSYDQLHLRLQRCLAEIEALHPRSVLELGCGVGILRAEILRVLPQVGYFGCDISQAAVTQINDPHVVRVVLGEEPLPFADRTFDCIVGSGIFEYIADLPAFVRSLHGKLNHGGALVCSYYNLVHLYRRVSEILGRSEYSHPEWKNRISLREFARVLESAGFVLERSRPTDVGLFRPRGAKSHETLPRALASRIIGRTPLQYLLAYQNVYVCRKR